MRDVWKPICPKCDLKEPECVCGNPPHTFPPSDVNVLQDQMTIIGTVHLNNINVGTGDIVAQQVGTIYGHPNSHTVRYTFDPTFEGCIICSTEGVPVKYVGINNAPLCYHCIEEAYTSLSLETKTGGLFCGHCMDQPCSC